MQVRNRIKKLAQLDPSQIVPNPKNWRTHPHAQREVLGGLFADIGIVNACIVRPIGDDKFMLIDGHLRTEVLADQKIPCIILDVNEQEADKILLSLDPLSAMAELDPTKLNELLATVDMSGASLASMYENLKYQAETFVIPQSESLPEVKTEIIEDDPPEPPAEPVTKPGDMWVMGAHRLLCGDSTNADDVSRLLNGGLPFIMVTDPPYGVEYDPMFRERVLGAAVRRTGTVRNDSNASWDLAYSHFSGDVAYVWHADRFAIEVGLDIRKCKFQIRATIIWKKPHLPFGQGHYSFQHEPCWYAVRNGGTAKWNGSPGQHSTVWEIALKDSTGESHHGTQKPVECMARPIRNHGGKDDDVYDPFLGSGTTLIAAEQLGRRCYGMEISPAYCDVIVNRWEKLTGKKAILEKSHGTEVFDGGRAGVDVGGVPVGEAEGTS